MKVIVDRSVESVVSLLRRLDHLSKGDLGDLGLVADDLENTVEEDFYNFLNWVKSGNCPPQDYTFEETGISGKTFLCQNHLTTTPFFDKPFHRIFSLINMFVKLFKIYFNNKIVNVAIYNQFADE